MSYTKQTWACGDTITADKLNHMENGIEEAVECCGGGSEVLIARATSITEYDDVFSIVYDKTWQQIHDAIANGTPCYVGNAYMGDDFCMDLPNVEDLTDVMIPIFATEYISDDGVYEIITVRNLIAFALLTAPENPICVKFDCGLPDE